MGDPNSDSQLEVLAFSVEQVCRLTDLTLRQVRYWDDTEFFSPEYAPGYRRAAYSRVYSFRDVVGLSTISLLRKHVPLQTLRLVGGYLRRYHDTPWASLALYVRGREVIFRDPDSPDVYLSAIAQGQKVIPIQLQVIARAVGKKAQTLKLRRHDQMGKVYRHRYVAHNKPVLAGTRIPTSAVWNLHEAGYSAQRIIAEFPRLGTPDIRAAIQYERKRRRKKAG